jgi:hypothetical protein
MVRLTRVETRPGHRFGVIFGRDERAREVYAVVPFYEAVGWRDRLEAGEDVQVSVPTQRLER